MPGPMRDLTDKPANAEGRLIGIAVSTYHEGITSSLLEGARTAFLEHGGSEENLIVSKVPGAWELPLACSALAHRGVDAAVAIGCIIAGETTHDQVLAAAVSNGLMQISIDRKLPIGFGVLTCQSRGQGAARAGGDRGNKGSEAMLAALGALDAALERAI